MKFDSHVKLTSAALRLLRTRCHATPECRAATFDDSSRSWRDSQLSQPHDNYRSAAGPTARAGGRWLGRNSVGPNAFSSFFAWYDALFPDDLATCVAAVDVNEIWTHEHPEGQKYHFQRVKGQSDLQGYTAALGFIHAHTLRWVNAAKRSAATNGSNWWGRLNRRFDTAGFRTELALALHCLQDSFSTAHVVRRYGQDRDSFVAAATLLRGGSVAGAPAIVGLTCYAEQDHALHGQEDYVSGGLVAGTGRMAVEATVDLISVGLLSMSAPAGLVGWDRFVNKWLRERIPRIEGALPVAQRATGASPRQMTR